MADMERFDDIAVFINQFDIGSAAVAARVAIPRAVRVVKTYSVSNDTQSAAPVITLASDKGDLTDVHTCVDSSGADEMSEQDYRPEVNNAFAKGSYLTATVATQSAGHTVGFTIVLRPL